MGNGWEMCLDRVGNLCREDMLVYVKELAAILFKRSKYAIYYGLSNFTPLHKLFSPGDNLAPFHISGRLANMTMPTPVYTFWLRAKLLSMPIL